MSPSPFQPTDTGGTLSIKLTPKASSERVQGIEVDEVGCALVKVAVTAPPIDGKANTALIKLMAKSLHLPKSTLTILKGHSDRRKVIVIEASRAGLSAQTLGEMVQLWLKQL